MIAVKLWGGIGNQLFQYGFGCYLAEKRNEHVFFSTEKQIEISKLPISYFDLNISLLTIDQLKSINYYFQNPYFYRLYRKICKVFPFVNNKVVVEKKLYFHHKIFQQDKFYDGYWQSYKYLLPIEKILRNKLTFNETDFSEIYLKDQIKVNNSISIHIRRGDYLSKRNNRLFENCSKVYYQNAIDFISTKIEKPHFYIFSNDIDWIKQNFIFKKSLNCTYVENSNLPNNVLTDLYLMSLCKHHIIANSTFSWWGAWLNASEEKIVISPLKWYKGKLNESTIDLIPPKWIRM